jgi:hypothetical protein
MTMLLPRLAREETRRILDKYSGCSIDEISAAMPFVVDSLTYSTVGGSTISDSQMRELRSELVAVAREHGMPGPVSRGGFAAFEGQVAGLLHAALPIAPHEASHEEVWSYLTCCWLLDIAVWRFGAEADARRFIGNVNRNTFRRLWWRAEVLGAGIDLTRLGEDELVSIMERPTIASDRRLARLIASEFLVRVERDSASERMQLMREAMKRFLRLTPFVAFSSLDDAALNATVCETFDEASASLGGQATEAIARPVVAASPASADVYLLDRVSLTSSEGDADAVGEEDFAVVAQAALAIARRTGRVTNATLREAVPVTSDDARRVLKMLTNQGVLESRGARRGTHYVVVETPPDEANDIPALGSPDMDQTSASAEALPTTARTPVDDALRRVLRRRW